MRKILLLLMLSISFISCKPKSVTNAVVDNKTERDIKGNWILQSVSYPGSDYIKVTSFDIADSKCFVGSSWKFVSNNNKGEMALTKSGCPAFSSAITWYVNKESMFVMKILDEGLKSKKVKEGNILKFQNQTEDSFELVDKINVGGKLTDVVYQFQKN